MDILLLLPWVLWTRLVVWPMIISEFQQKIQDAIKFEKEFYKEKDAKEKSDPWTANDIYEILSGKHVDDKWDATDPRIARITRTLPDSSGSERFYKELKKEIDPKISEATCQRIAIIISEYIDDIEKMNKLRSILITYYH
jgi:hypothetical protein